MVSVEVGVETFQARATITTGAERQRLWAAHVAAIPHFATYEKMVERELQVVTLEPSPPIVNLGEKEMTAVMAVIRADVGVVVGDTGLEPVTSCMSSKCSNQLS